MQKLTSKLCAVKSINMDNINAENAIKKITTERTLMQNLRHPSIVKMLEWIKDDHSVTNRDKDG